MKHTKKLFSLALAFIMAMALMVPAFAVEANNGTNNSTDVNYQTGTITIDNPVLGEDYAIYRLLDLESYSNTTGAFSYKVNSAWENFFKLDEIVFDETIPNDTGYVVIDGQGYVTWKDGASAADFAALAIAFAKTNRIGAVAGPVSPTYDSANDKVEEIVFTGLPLGYYLIDSSLGTLCALDTTNNEVTVYEKNGAPASEKKVQEDSTSAYGASNTADIIDTINYQVTITVPGGKTTDTRDDSVKDTTNPGAQDYILHDVMDEGLVFGSVTGITLNGEAVDADDYDVKKTGLTDGCTFEVEFKPAFCAGLKKDDKVVVSYTAVFDNTKEITAGQGYENNAWLTYGDKQTQTPATTTSTKTFDVDVFKFYKNGSTETGLADAEFKLYKEVNGVKYYAVTSEPDSNVYTLTAWVTEEAAEADENVEVRTFISPADGLFTIHGLDADTYYLVETEAPDGYNKLANPVTIVIDEAGRLNPVDKDEDGEIEDGEYETQIKVENKSGAELPSTGGMGTTIFYVVGGVLMAGAAILLITKKKMSDDQ